MSKLTQLLNQITDLIQSHNPEKWTEIELDTGLELDVIKGYLEGKSYKLPAEIIELYQWRNGKGYGSFFLSAESGYSDQEFYSLATGLGWGEEWEQDYCSGTSLLALFSFEGTYCWTVLSEESQEFAPIYITDEPCFDTTSSPSYPSLTTMLEKRIKRLEFVWKIE